MKGTKMNAILNFIIFSCILCILEADGSSETSYTETILDDKQSSADGLENLNPNRKQIADGEIALSVKIENIFSTGKEFVTHFKSSHSKNKLYSFSDRINHQMENSGIPPEKSNIINQFHSSHNTNLSKDRKSKAHHIMIENENIDSITNCKCNVIIENTVRFAHKTRRTAKLMKAITEKYTKVKNVFNYTNATKQPSVNASTYSTKRPSVNASTYIANQPSINTSTYTTNQPSINALTFTTNQLSINTSTYAKKRISVNASTNVTIQSSVNSSTYGGINTGGGKMANKIAIHSKHSSRTFSNSMPNAILRNIRDAFTLTTGKNILNTTHDNVEKSLRLVHFTKGKIINTRYSSYHPSLTLPNYNRYILLLTNGTNMTNSSTVNFTLSTRISIRNSTTTSILQSTYPQTSLVIFTSTFSPVTPISLPNTKAVTIIMIGGLFGSTVICAVSVKLYKKIKKKIINARGSGMSMKGFLN